MFRALQRARVKPSTGIQCRIPTAHLSAAQYAVTCVRINGKVAAATKAAARALSTNTNPNPLIEVKSSQDATVYRGGSSSFKQLAARKTPGPNPKGTNPSLVNHFYHSAGPDDSKALHSAYISTSLEYCKAATYAREQIGKAKKDETYTTETGCVIAMTMPTIYVPLHSLPWGVFTNSSLESQVESTSTNWWYAQYKEEAEISATAAIPLSSIMAYKKPEETSGCFDDDRSVEPVTYHASKVKKPSGVKTHLPHGTDPRHNEGTNPWTLNPAYRATGYCLSVLTMDDEAERTKIIDVIIAKDPTAREIYFRKYIEAVKIREALEAEARNFYDHNHDVVLNFHNKAKVSDIEKALGKKPGSGFTSEEYIRLHAEGFWNARTQLGHKKTHVVNMGPLRSDANGPKFYSADGTPVALPSSVKKHGK